VNREDKELRDVLEVPEGVPDEREVVLPLEDRDDRGVTSSGIPSSLDDSLEEGGISPSPSSSSSREDPSEEERLEGNSPIRGDALLGVDFPDEEPDLDGVPFDEDPELDLEEARDGVISNTDPELDREDSEPGREKNPGLDRAEGPRRGGLGRYPRPGRKLESELVRELIGDGGGR
jgi:hypothetical protein